MCEQNLDKNGNMQIDETGIGNELNNIEKKNKENGKIEKEKVHLQFLMNVRSQKETPFEYRLSKIDNLVKKIYINEFGNIYILNYSLLEYAFENNLEVKNLIIKKLDSENIIFIDGFLDTTQYSKEFVELLSPKWFKILQFIENNSNYTEVKKRTYHKLLLSYVKLSEAKEIFKNHIDSFSKDKDFLSIIKDKNRLQEIISVLGLKFENLDIEKSPEQLGDFVYENNHYKTNTTMVRLFIDKYRELDEDDWAFSNYKSIKESKCSPLIDYIDSNINDYIGQVYLNIDSNINEGESSFIELINNKEISTENLEVVISTVQTKISDINHCNYTNIQKLLVVHNKMVASWDNLIAFYKEDNDFFNSVIEYINITDNAKELADSCFHDYIAEDDDEGYDFGKKVLENGEIEDMSYAYICKSFSYDYSDLNFSNLSKKNIKSLISNEIFEPTVDMYNKLKLDHEYLNIYLVLKYKAEFFDLIEELEFDSNEIELLLSSIELDIIWVHRIIEIYPVATIFSSKQSSNIVYDLIILDDSFVSNDEVIENLITSLYIAIDNRIELFNKNVIEYDFDLITTFLNKLGVRYNVITNKHKKGKISDTDLNRELLINLESQGYISSYSTFPLRGLLRVNHKRS